MAAIKDLTGQRFGRLTVLELAGIKNENALWRCKCDCGNVCDVRGGALTSGKTQSCGCLKRIRTIESHTKHGKAGTWIYQSRRKTPSFSYGDIRRTLTFKTNKCKIKI